MYNYSTIISQQYTSCAIITSFKVTLAINSKYVVAMWCLIILPVVLCMAIHCFYRNASNMSPFPANRLTKHMLQVSVTSVVTMVTMVTMLKVCHYDHSDHNYHGCHRDHENQILIPHNPTSDTHHSAITIYSPC